MLLMRLDVRFHLVIRAQRVASERDNYATLTSYIDSARGIRL